MALTQIKSGAIADDAVDSDELAAYEASRTTPTE